MGLLDRFRAQPRWKNASPAVRTAAVEELPLDQQDTLISIAREDRDPGVRIAALRKVIDPTAIAALGHADADERVREEAVTLLVDLATGAFEGTDQAESLVALKGLTDHKHVVAVARGATSEAVARAALTRLEDEGSLGSIARRAALSAIRLEALARITGQAEVAAVAARTDFKDSALAAVERLSDRDVLDDVANRAKNKTAAKRARMMVRALDSGTRPVGGAEAAQPASASDPAVDAERQRVRTASRLCGRLETLVTSGLDEGDAELAEVERSWSALGEVADADLVERFDRARDAAQQALSQHLAERAERARLLAARAEAVEARRAICERVDALAGDETPARIEEARTAWTAVTPLADGTEAERWQRRLDEACGAADVRYRAAVRQRANRERAVQLCGDAERLAKGPAGAQVSGEAQALRRAWRDLVAAGVDDAGLIARFEEADGRLRVQEAEAREQRARAQQENLARLQSLVLEIEGLVASPALTLKQAERALREARAALDDTGPLPSRHEQDQLSVRLKGALAALFPRVQELRDMDEWQRWANAGVQEDLCRRVEALMQVGDLASAAKQLRELQAQWKQVATASRDQSQDLWNTFKVASDAVRARCDVYFTRMAEEQASNRARKEALCQQAEALSSSTNWIPTAEAIKALQAEWKTVGAAPRAQEKALWDRFHSVCDAFFTRRREDLLRRKEEWAANLARKEAVCQQAEAIAETTEWQQGIDAVKRLQGEWKTIGPVRKNRADDIWQRFRAACDRFFERYQQREHAAASSAIGDAEAVCQELEGLVPAADAESPPVPDAIGATVAGLRARWAGLLPGLPRQGAIRLGDRVTHALARLADAWPASFAGTDLDPDANARMLEELCVQIERILAPEAEASPGAAAPAEDESPSTLLARQLRDALASNTIAGRQDETAKWKAAAEQVRAAQAAWRRVGPVPEGAARSLGARFQRACTRVADKIDQHRRGVTGR